MQHNDTTLPGPVVLRIELGPEKGRVITLDRSGTFELGRHTDCAIRLDAENTQASRRHAALHVGATGELELEDLQSNNGTFVNDARIERATLGAGDRFSVGNTLFIVERTPLRRSEVADPDKTIYRHAPLQQRKTRSPLRLLTLGLALLLALGLLWAALMRDAGKRPDGPPQTDGQVARSDQDAALPEPVEAFAPESAAPAAEAPAPVPAPVTTPEPAPTAPSNGAPAEELFQKGMFFYKAGNLPRALELWSQAYARDPGHAQARHWLLRGEQELDAAMDSHYRQGLLAKKYMRYDEARYEFQLVTQWCRNPEDQRCKDAALQLKELQGGRP